MEKMKKKNFFFRFRGFSVKLVCNLKFWNTDNMKSPKKKFSREMIGNFYKLHHSKGKLYTYTNFKKSGFSKSQIHAIMQTFDQTGGQKSIMPWKTD